MSKFLERLESTTPLLDGCSDSCGWIAAGISALAYGTYGVPIKETKYLLADLNPLVFQTYKTFVMLVLAPPVVILLGGTPFRFSLWGLLSGLLWVLGGTGGVVAIRWAGMALAVGTWASVMIAVNFVWGLLIFAEPIASWIETVAAFALLTLGLIGMSTFGSPSSNNHTNSENSYIHAPSETPSLEPSDESEKPPPNELSKLLSTNNTITTSGAGQGGLDSWVAVTTTHVHIGTCISLRLRTAGVAAAVVNGLMSGSSLIPMHYAAKHHHIGGAHYMLSYAVGAAVANAALWLLYFLLQVIYVVATAPMTSSNDTPSQPLSSNILYQALAYMPDFYVRKLWRPGFAAGFFLATAMFASIISVTYLGQGIGNSVVQAKIIISGMWGIFYYKEISSPQGIRNWFLSASLSVMGIVWLSQERLTSPSSHA